MEATFIDENTLLVLTDLLQDGDEVDIATRSNSSTHRVLTRTESYIYHEPQEGSQEGTLTPVSEEEEEQAAEGSQTEGTPSEDSQSQGAQTEENPTGETQEE